MRNLLVGVIVIFLMGCGKKKNEQPGPSPVVLLLPKQNEACTVSSVISATESKVKFKWETGQHADSYVLNIKNLINGASISNELTDTEAEITLQRDVPYSWYVVSKSNGGEKAINSAVWKFYNPGLEVTSHTPFPAEILSPLMAQQVAFGSGKITLDWNGSDVDNDIAEYDVYFGVSKNPALLSAKTTSSILNDVVITANTTYYWRVITKDSKGNTSDSGLFEFKVN